MNPFRKPVDAIRRGIARMIGARVKEDVSGLSDDREPPDHRFFRPMGQGRGFRSAIRNLRPQDQIEQSKQAFRFFIENPFIRRLSKMVAEFIVGNGVSVKSKNPDVQAELDAWWEDPVNDMEARHFTIALEGPLYGELIFERIVNTFTGMHRYSALDPLFAANVIAHAKYPTIPAFIDFWSATGGGAMVRATIANGVPEEAMIAVKPSTDPEPVVFYFRKNALSGSLRGHSNFYPLFEWADVLDNAAFTMAERMVILLTYVWHIKSDNLDEKTKKTYKEQLEQANPGSALITGKNVDFAAVTPDLKAADFTEGARFIKNLIAGCVGVPAHWMGETEEATYASAKASTLPTLRSFLQDQREYVRIIRTLAKANLVSVAARGRIPMTEVDNFTVQVDPMDDADVKLIADSLTAIMGALGEAKTQGWISDDEARQAVRNIVGGIAEIDPNAAPSAADQQATAGEKAAADRVRKLFADGGADGGASGAQAS